MMARIKIKLHRDRITGQDYRAVYLGCEHVRSFWQLDGAMRCAERLAELSAAEIQTAEVVPLPKAGT